MRQGIILLIFGLLGQDYERALKYVDAIRHIEPSNHQARQLHNYIKKKMEKGQCCILFTKAVGKTSFRKIKYDTSTNNQICHLC